MLITQGTMFGGLLSVNRVAATGGVPTLGYAFWQAFAAGAILLAAGLALGRAPSLRMAHLRFYVATGTLAFAGPFVVLAYVAPRLPAGVVTLVITLTPALTYVTALAIGSERWRAPSLIGLALGLAGIALVIIPGGGLPAPDMAGWVLVALIVPVTSALSNVVAERFRPPRSSSLALAGGMLSAGAVALFPVMLASGETYLFPARFEAHDWAVVIAIAINAANFILFFEIVRRAGAVFFSQFNYVAVVAGIIWGMLLFEERHSGWLWAALALMLAGLALVNRGAAHPAPAPGED
ncbi:MAG: DMT family transporter [Alphaproteobacteria bacterium]|nr:DMT family transporter [Alphaproteobacteria bacterium]